MIFEPLRATGPMTFRGCSILSNVSRALALTRGPPRAPPLGVPPRSACLSAAVPAAAGPGEKAAREGVLGRAGERCRLSRTPCVRGVGVVARRGLAALEGVATASLAGGDSRECALGSLGLLGGVPGTGRGDTPLPQRPRGLGDGGRETGVPRVDGRAGGAGGAKPLTRMAEGAGGAEPLRTKGRSRMMLAFCLGGLSIAPLAANGRGGRPTGVSGGRPTPARPASLPLS